jgi:hypothetical protein
MSSFLPALQQRARAGEAVQRFTTPRRPNAEVVVYRVSGR